MNCSLWMIPVPPHTQGKPGSQDYSPDAWGFGTPIAYQLYGAPIVGLGLAG